MSKDLNLSYYYGTEADQYSFYRIPKILFTDKRFKDVSVDAKVLYGLMLDRMALSMKNGWLDESNRVFIFFTLEDAIELLGYGHSKIIKLLSELDTTKGIGLIERKKQGQGKPTVIYVKSFVSMDAQKNATQRESNKSYPRPQFKTSEKQKSETGDFQVDSTDATVDSQNSMGNDEFQQGFDEDSSSISSNFEDAEVLTSEKQKSRHLKNGSLDFSKTDTNKTKEIYTEINETQSIYPSISSYTKQNQKNLQNDGLMDGIIDVNLEELVLEEMKSKRTLPDTYIADERKMTIAIHELTEYNHYLASAKEDAYRNSFEFSAVKLFNEALIEMLTTKKPMMLKGSYITYDKVYEKLISYIQYTHSPYGSIYGLQDVALGDFTKACSEQSIKNHLQYMKAVIWNAMQVGDIGIKAMLKKDFG